MTTETPSGNRVIAWINEHRTQLIGVAFWLVIIIATRQYMQANDLTFRELTNQLAEILTGTWYGPLLYIVVYLLRPLILFPASLLTILAGSIYGLAFGFLYGLIAGTLSAAVPYFAGRWFAGEEEATEQAKEEGDSNVFKRFIALMQENPFQTILTMRLLYMPYDAVSLLAGGLRIGFVPFATATLIGNLGGTFSFVGFGASLQGDIATGEVSINPWILALSFSILVASLALSRYLNKREAAKTEKPQMAMDGA